MIECRECNKKFKEITWSHLHYKHNMSIDEYKEKFPNAIITPKELKKLRSNTLIREGKNTRFVEGDDRLVGDNNPNANGISKKVRKKISRETRKAMKREDVKANLKESVKERFNDQKGCEKMAKIAKEAWKNEDYRKRQIKSSRETATKMHRDKETHMRMISGIIGGNNPMNKEKYRKKVSESKKGVKRPDMEGEKNPAKDKKVREKISKSRREHKPTYPKAYYVKDLGHKVRSSWEEDVGVILKENNIKYEYENKAFKIEINGNMHTYRPDFIIDDKIVIEPHNFVHSTREKKKFKKFNEQYQEYTFIIISINKHTDICDIFIYYENLDKLIGYIEDDMI